MRINNYRDGQESDAEPEHFELLQDFREEYLAQLEAAGADGFQSGILFPAIPVLVDDPEFELGIDIVKRYLSDLPSFS